MKIMRFKKVGGDERGLVAIFSTLIIMTILTLLVISFSNIAKDEINNASNDQLSTQAFYAAESGVNDAYQTISNIIAANINNPNPWQNIPTQTQACTSINGASTYTYVYPVPSATQESNILNSGDNTQYSCLLVNPTPSVLEYSVANSQAQVIPLISSNNANINDITIAWSNSSPASCSSFPALVQTRQQQLTATVPLY